MSASEDGRATRADARPRGVPDVIPETKVLLGGYEIELEYLMAWVERTLEPTDDYDDSIYNLQRLIWTELSKRYRVLELRSGIVFVATDAVLVPWDKPMEEAKELIPLPSPRGEILRAHLESRGLLFVKQSVTAYRIFAMADTRYASLYPGAPDEGPISESELQRKERAVMAFNGYRGERTLAPRAAQTPAPAA